MRVVGLTVVNGFVVGVETDAPTPDGGRWSGEVVATPDPDGQPGEPAVAVEGNR